MALSIAEALYIEADDALHADYVFSAKVELKAALNNRPRVDNGEWMIYAQARMDAMHEYFSEKAGFPLRRITIDIDAGAEWCLTIEPRPPLFYKEKRTDG
jgi:hypothetical protein